jgi:uncharacterized protein YsxB (DUF464 family)
VAAVIRVRLTDGDTVRLEVRGHAGAGPYGSDVVCAAVSALVETLALGLRAIGDGESVVLDEGVFRYEGHPDERGRLLLGTFLLGFRSLAESHGAFVRLEERGPRRAGDGRWSG